MHKVLDSSIPISEPAHDDLSLNLFVLKELATQKVTRYSTEEYAGIMAVKSNPEKQSPQSFRIDEELDHVLHSTSFQGSKQCQVLLRYLVEKSLGGQESDGSLKERTIGVEVFGRKHDYNTTDDAIVRARVGEVRKRLAQYYMSPDGQGSAIEIAIPLGSYRPRFTFRPDKDLKSKESEVKLQPQAEPSYGADKVPEAGAAAPVSRLPRPARWRTWGVAAVAACAVVLVACIFIPKWTKSQLDLFWGPFFDSGKPAVICMGTAPVYTPTAASTERALSLASPDDLKQPMAEWPLPQLPGGQALTANDVLIDHRNFVAVGDIGAVVSVVQLLTAHHRSFTLRSGTNLPFEDLRGAPLVLTGAGSNYWAIDMTRNLPFFVDRGLRIRERGGKERVWSAGLWSDHTITEDYAIVSRLLDSQTGAPVITLAGITMCGTRAAGEFVTDPVQMRKLRSVPRDALDHKNLEFVLHVNLVDCNPTSTDVVDVRYW